ncbi:MAG: hypothetical protein ACRYHQ_25215 [Janthinobacterium lividum]
MSATNADSATITANGPQVRVFSASGPAHTLVFSDPKAFPFVPAEVLVDDVTLSQNCTVSITGGQVGMFQRQVLILRQPASGSTFTATLPSNVSYPGGSPPAVGTGAGSATMITFATPDGGKTLFAIESASFPSVTVNTAPVTTSGGSGGTTTSAGLNYAKAQMNGSAGNVTLTLPHTATAGNHALLLWGAAGQPTMPAGWTQLAAQSVSNGYAASAWVAPVSALTSNGLTIPNGYGGAYLIEDASVSFDATTSVAAAGTGNGITANAPPLASGKTVAQRYAVVCAYRGQNDSVVPDRGCTAIDQTAGGDGVGNAFTVLLALDPVASSYSMQDSGGVYINANPSVVGVNGYTS